MLCSIHELKTAAPRWGDVRPHAALPFSPCRGGGSAGMAGMSKVYDATARELYMGAGDREHD
jgi:hypothetical protein